MCLDPRRFTIEVINEKATMSVQKLKPGKLFMYSVVACYTKHYLLQVKLKHVPFHFRGGGPKPPSVKLSLYSQIPLSSTPTIMSLSTFVLWTFSGKPRKFQDLDVWILWTLFGITDTTPSISGQTFQIFTECIHHN